MTDTKTAAEWYRDMPEDGVSASGELYLVEYIERILAQGRREGAQEERKRNAVLCDYNPPIGKTPEGD